MINIRKRNNLYEYRFEAGKVNGKRKQISNDEYVNKFINSKRLEGCSELTIKNHKIHIYKMLSYLDKDVRTIKTDDIRDFLSYY